MSEPPSKHEATPKPGTIVFDPVPIEDTSKRVLYGFFALCATCHKLIVSEDYFKTWAHVID